MPPKKRLPPRSGQVRPILYGSEFALLQFTHRAGTAALGWCLPVTQFLDAGLVLVSMVSINLGIWFDGVEQGDAGKTIEREESQ